MASACHSAVHSYLTQCSWGASPAVNLTKEVLMCILLYADDIALVCDTAEKLREEAVITMNATFCIDNNYNT